MLSGNGRHRRPRQAPAVVVAAGVTGSALALPLFAASGASAADGATWDRVAECESGGAWSADTGNGFFGGLQLTQDQWKENGGLSYAASPAEASRSQQIAVAEPILAEQGATPWLACGAMNGLREDAPAAQVDTGVDALRTGDVTDTGAFDGSASGWGSAGGDRTGGSDAGRADEARGGGLAGAAGDTDQGALRGGGHGLFPGGDYAPADGGSFDLGQEAGQDQGQGLDLGEDLGLVDTGTGAPVVPDLPEVGGGDTGEHGGGQSGDQGDNGTGKGDGEDKGDTGQEETGDTGSSDEDAPLLDGEGDPLFGDDTPLFGDDAAAEEDADASSGSGRHRGASAEESTETTSGSSGRHAAPVGTYTVQAGESLISIAKSQDVQGGWRALYEANEDLIGDDPNRLVAGTKLSLPA
ncbi:transglycosylase family protein [Streptomyces fragilis]|uniref:Transglycosylase family protein n=1 Tax=Streptomyces fragilis TaxID=67301 RepID=A0ABV2YFS8_9ACTN|nr:transglycosylase family protein [Streptomyces fragilis]